jgi:putative ABC transport system substrate-binding protein
MRMKQAPVPSLLIAVVLLAAAVTAEAQQPKNVPRIGYLAPTADHRVEAFRQGLRELGYTDGKNISIEYRSPEANRWHTPAAELVRLKVDVIVTGGSNATRAAKEAASAIPIVMVQDPDPIGNGFVASLARPGGNITGLSSLVAELGGKRLELLQNTVPKVSRVFVFGTSTFPGNAQALRDMELAADTFGVKLHYVDVLSPKDIETAYLDANKGRADGLLVVGGSVFFPQRKQLVELAAKSRLPAVYHQREYVDAGGLMSYGVSVADLARRAATYVDKILKGANPADLPIEQPTKFELAINLKAAKQIGLTIPPQVLARADKVIK